MLKLLAVARTYQDGAPVRALRSTTVDIMEGDYVTITGPSGSGKSTLLNILGLLDAPTEGAYYLRGVDTSLLDEASRGAVRGQLFGFVFQSFHLLAGRSAVENVALGMLYGRHSQRHRNRLASEALDRVGMAHRADADPQTLSGGERQRVAIARAIAGRPQVVFCDEPTGNLDSANGDIVLALLRELHSQGLTLVVVTHSPQVAAEGGRRLRVLDGEVTEC